MSAHKNRFDSKNRTKTQCTFYVCIYKRNQIMNKSGFYALELGIFKISIMLKSILYLLPGPGCSKAD